MDELRVGTIVVDCRGKLAVITGLNTRSVKYPYLYQLSPDSRTQYKANASDFRAVLGTVDIDAFNSATITKTPNRMSSGVDDDLLVPPVLKGVKVGDKIRVRTRGGVRKVEYRGYHENRPKYPVSIVMDGKEYKTTLTSVVPDKNAEDVVKRSEAQIMEDIRDAYCRLSPENLTCDGELPQREVAKRARELQKRLSGLFRELGREVGESEAYA